MLILENSSHVSPSVSGVRVLDTVNSQDDIVTRGEVTCLGWGPVTRRQNTRPADEVGEVTSLYLSHWDGNKIVH